MSVVVWFTGLPSSGKSTLARRVLAALREKDTACCLLDSDELREAMVPRHGFDPEGRHAFYATASRLAGLLARQGLITLVAATANLRVYRKMGRDAAPKFLLVYVATPLAECKRRDAKELYARAEAGELAHVPGVDVPYEPPSQPDVIDDGSARNGIVMAIVARVEDLCSTGERG